MGARALALGCGERSANVECASTVLSQMLFASENHSDECVGAWRGERWESLITIDGVSLAPHVRVSMRLPLTLREPMFGTLARPMAE
jgi:hypothetical protein